MNIQLARRLGSQTTKCLVSKVASESGYLILALIAVLVSAVATEWSDQLLTVAFIFGWKWICGSQTQVIQVYTTDINQNSSI
jgi:hypothetical protein